MKADRRRHLLDDANPKPSPHEQMARLARKDADSLEFWASTCMAAMDKAGHAPSFCAPIRRTITELRGLAACVESDECTAIGDAAARERVDDQD